MAQPLHKARLHPFITPRHPGPGSSAGERVSISTQNVVIRHNKRADAHVRMSDSTFNIERATNGLVLALFLASALFLAVMLYFVLQDIDERQSKQAASDAQAALVRTTPVSPSHVSAIRVSGVYDLDVRSSPHAL